ncbi:LytTR family transcriptional regulator DNA-binding domain-containing protein [Actinoallomurus purpureus]|uniref:LytR/AlgR family response regulator transcription factor n=1 Tax=Actinoallomurus purpureus TaxID=478114 RepID=UPI002092C178|nr:response regulator [Actinoallomurus purpureus]MCO6005717.1 LytTR family transcriptional regulator DNA-binding domain-containing protein [Actinoallomurus purpureus]
MLRVLAADDEAPALEELTYLLRRHPRIEHVKAARDAAEALREIGRMIKSGERLDAVFLDICMPALDGLDFARLAAGFADPPAIVFVTAHDEFAVTAFEFGAVDYLLKPIDPDRLSEAVRRVDEAVHRDTTPPEPEADEVIPVELGGRTRLISRADVTHAETHGDYIRLHTADGSYLLRMPLAVLAERWQAAGFIRIHRKTLVAAAHITELRFEEGRVLLEIGDRLLPVSRRHTREVRDLLIRRFRQRPEPPDE